MKVLFIELIFGLFGGMLFLLLDYPRIGFIIIGLTFIYILGRYLYIKKGNKRLNVEVLRSNLTV